MNAKKLSKDSIVKAYRDLVKTRGGRLVGGAVFARETGISTYYTDRGLLAELGLGLWFGGIGGLSELGLSVPWPDSLISSSPRSSCRCHASQHARQFERSETA